MNLSDKVVSLELAKQLHEKEEWRDVVGYEGLYKVSNLGRVKSKRRSGAIGGIMKLANIRGYRNIVLTKENKGKTFIVHRMVAQAFIPNPKKFPQVNHLNGIRDDNCVENLEWCTGEQNKLHAREVLGQDFKGVKNGRAKLTEREVKFIRWLKARDNKISAKKIGDFYGMSDTAICNIWNFKRWKHL